ncbi:MAG: tRNA lysidine(34) synthetase TilS [Chloroflexi bacterium]|nr:tRNA lysidine(34) synthetase TilS [Chloroflexota bacterium]
MDLQALAEILELKCGVTKSSVLLAGVSGGPDSLCLLDALHRLGYAVIAAHFNHHLRPEADEDARRVAEMAEERGLRSTLGEGDVAALAEDSAMSVEEAARVKRYEFLFEQARRVNAQAVVVGHTADDQVETVLMHLLRGAGLAGLKGMTYTSLNPEWDASIPLVRPLLGIWREETEAYCAEFSLQPVTDASNRDTTYFRNRLRHELIPFLQSYNPRIRTAIWRTSFSLAGDFDTVQQVSRQALANCLQQQSKGYLALDLPNLKGLSPGVQRGVLRLAITRLRPQIRDVDYLSIDRALDFIARPPLSGRTDLLGGLSLIAETDRLYLVDSDARLPETGWLKIDLLTPARLEGPGKVIIADDWALIAEWVDAGDRCLIDLARKASPYEAWLEGERELFPLVVRRRAPGDRFQPLGMDGKWVKLSDFFMNVKLPRRARDRWPLVCAQDQIVWIPRYRPAHAMRITAATRKALYLRLERRTSDKG